MLFFFREDPKERAIELFHKGYAELLAGRFPECIALMKESAMISPTAEALSFMGNALSQMGRLDEAIAACLDAISVDPDFGNPYNDIGAYFIRSGRYEEALPWFDAAEGAPRYAARHYPPFNRGLVMEKLGRWDEAAECYRAALRACPAYADAVARLTWIGGMRCGRAGWDGPALEAAGVRALALEGAEASAN